MRTTRSPSAIWFAVSWSAPSGRATEWSWAALRWCTTIIGRAPGSEARALHDMESYCMPGGARDRSLQPGDSAQSGPAATEQGGEFADGDLHRLRLGGELLGGGGGLFRGGGIRLGALVHLRHGPVDLFDAVGLLP